MRWSPSGSRCCADRRAAVRRQRGRRRGQRDRQPHPDRADRGLRRPRRPGLRHRQPREVRRRGARRRQRPLCAARRCVPPRFGAMSRCRSSCPARIPERPGFADKICNSANQADGGAFGGTLFFDQGWIGASASTYRSGYGTVAEHDVTIGMKSDRYALEGEWRPGGFFSSVHAKLSRTEYRHTEYEGPLARHHLHQRQQRPADRGTAPPHRRLRRHGRLHERERPLLGQRRGGLRAEQPNDVECGVPARGVRHLVGPPELRCAAPRRSRCARWAIRPTRSSRASSSASAISARAAPLSAALVEPVAAMAADLEPGLHRAGAEGLRAVRQRPARRDRGLGNRRSGPEDGEVDRAGPRRPMEVGRQHGQRSTPT